MFKRVSITFLLTIFAAVTAFADNYSAIANLPLAASNAILQNMREGYRIRDYELYRTAAQRAIQLNLSNSLIIFKEIFSAGDPTVIIAQPPVIAELQPFYRFSALGLGAFGSETDAQMLAAALRDNTDTQNLFYIIRALGMMKGKTAALTALNAYTYGIDNVILAKELLHSLSLHNSRSSLNPLRSLLMNTRFGVIRGDITNVINSIEAGGE